MTALGGKRAYGDRLGKDRSLRHSCHSIARARLHPIATLAHMTKRGQFHFSRVFHRSVGVSPYRYIVYLRLRRAVELIREADWSSRKSRPLLASPTRATFRDGCGGFTAFPRPNWSPDSPRQTAGIFTTLPARRF